MTVTVKFISTNAPYVTGDLAGFEEAAARKYIEAGVAVLHQPEPEPEPKPKREPKAKLDAAPEPAEAA